MPEKNFYIILFAALLYLICGQVGLRDRVLIHALHKIEEQALVAPSQKLLFEGAVSGMVQKLYSELNDDYSHYIPQVKRKEYEEKLDNRFDGIGITYDINAVRKVPEILYPLCNSPAYHAGICSGDTILEISGKKTEGLTMEEISDLFSDAGSNPFTLSVLPFGQSDAKQYTLQRGPIQRDSINGDTIQTDGKRNFTLQTEPEIGYVRITSFSERTAQELVDVLKQLEEKKVRGLILDLRHNPGGYVDICVQIADFFIEPHETQSTIVSTRHRNGRTKDVHYARADRLFTLPMVVLIDGESASSSEILAACLQDYGRATIVGTRSFGKGLVQERFILPANSGMIYLTDASYWRPSGQNIHRSRDVAESDTWGVMPDPNGNVAVSKLQQEAQIRIRDARSNAICQDRDLYMAEFGSRLVEKLRLDAKKRTESGNADATTSTPPVPSDETLADKDETAVQKSEEPFQLQGNAPYFDPQLDHAIEMLRSN